MDAILQMAISDVFFPNENIRILMWISLKFILSGPIDNKPALVLTMDWHQTGNKPLSEPMMA